MIQYGNAVINKFKKSLPGLAKKEQERELLDV